MAEESERQEKKIIKRTEREREREREENNREKMRITKKRVWE